MLKNIYAWTMALAARKTAVWWLAIVAFVESSVFVVPADVLFLPMVLAKPKKAMFYALVATVASVLGGIAGWFLGHYAFESIARPILEFYGKLDSFEHLKSSVMDKVSSAVGVVRGVRAAIVSLLQTDHRPKPPAAAAGRL